ncbi:hypothetical protein C8F01DRAFT_1376752 [Mycena amicta]|nr:hypothetical protein C8F01DRAFT_1376752 [Mycena amicta]
MSSVAQSSTATDAQHALETQGEKLRHGHQALNVAPATSSTSGAPWSKLRQWVGGRDPTMQIDIDPDALEAEFERIKDTLTSFNPTAANAEARVGAMVVLELIEECRPTIMNVLTATRNDASGFDRQQVVEDVRTIQRSYDFVLSANDKATRLQWKTSRLLSQDAVQKLSATGRSETFSEPDQDRPSNSDERLARDATRVTGVQFENKNSFRSDDIGIGRLYGRKPPARSEVINAQPEPVTVVSSSQSHNLSPRRQNLTTLIAISFFGASITWSTVFSGTRGNLLLIAWSACLFIVGAVIASAATLLVFSEEDLLEKHDQVRWTVRVLSLISILHVFAGMLCITLAILLLDPAAQNLQGPGSPAGKMGFRAAGAYTIAAAGLAVLVAAAVWRRYSIPTWFQPSSVLARAFNVHRKM